MFIYQPSAVTRPGHSTCSPGEPQLEVTDGDWDRVISRNLSAETREVGYGAVQPDTTLQGQVLLRTLQVTSHPVLQDSTAVLNPSTQAKMIPARLARVRGHGVPEDGENET